MPTNDLSHLGTLFFNEGMLGFKLRKKGGEYRIGDSLLFYPCIDIDKYSVSDVNGHYMKHILYDIYKFTFTVIDKFEHDGEGENIHHYLIEVTPGFNVFHFNWTKKADEYLQMNTLYHGFGRLSTCGNPARDNPKIDPQAMKSIRFKGMLERLQVNQLWRDCIKNVPPKADKLDCTVSYEDILEGIGYPDDMSKFRSKISKYHNDQSSLESTAQNKASESLVYGIRMA
ncbi:MAG: hypothetical protein KA807_15825 [Prolixibacteraceae bacterium]|nr:hypothetical protein [Prolixibacteraceae bacterium]